MNEGGSGSPPGDQTIRKFSCGEEQGIEKFWKHNRGSREDFFRFVLKNGNKRACMQTVKKKQVERKILIRTRT